MVYKYVFVYKLKFILQGWCPLHAASEAGHYEIVNILIDHGAKVDNVTDTGYNCLHLAASGGHTTIVGRLVDAGSPLDDITEAGLYGAPLHYAAGKGHIGIVKLLLEAGANKDTQSEDNCTPLYYAVLGMTFFS